MRPVLILVAAAALALTGAGSALATSGTGAGGDFVVTVSLSPDQAETGDEITASASVANRTARWQLAWITTALTGPEGRTVRVSYPLLVPPGRTLALSVDFPAPALAPRGSYTLTLSAANARGTATASASIELV
jgi:hypothetical protein